MNKRTFDPAKAFFVIDSDCLDRVSEGFYGFTILDSRPVRTLEELGNREPEGDGAYVLVRRNGDKITISQDFIGGFGLYLFQKDGWFALSNSFMRLVEYVKPRYPMTLNLDYADFFLAADLCSVAYGQTLVKEIRSLDRCARVEIDIPSQKLEIRLTDYRENTVELSSPEGMALLDGWFTKWAGLIRNLKAETNNIQTDLSGGFDSRLTFSLLLGAGVDVSDIFVFSIHDELHTHAEDYEIASAIAEHYGFRLNDSSRLTPGIPLAEPKDILDLSLYTKLGFHKQIYNQSRFYEKPRYNFVGNGGECIRDYWNMTAQEYTDAAAQRAAAWPRNIAPRMEKSIRRILEDAFAGIREKYESFGRPLDPEELTLNLYRETRCRNHFGKAIVERSLANSITCAPLLDPMLHKLRRCDGTCADKNLLTAVICTRFSPELMDFKFDNERFIDPETIRYARELNAAYPFRNPWQERVPAVTEELPRITPAVPAQTVADIVMDVFRSPEMKGDFIPLYGPDGYETAKKDIETRAFYPLQSAYAVISVGWVRRETEVSRNLRCPSLGEGFCSRSRELRESVREYETLRSHPVLDNYITARVDMKLEAGDVEILEVSDWNARVYTPDYMLRGGTGYVVESRLGQMKLRLRCLAGGKLHLILRGLVVRDRENQRIPYFVDYNSFKIDGRELLKGRRPVSHDVPFKQELEVQPGQEIVLELTWLPHDEKYRRMLERYRPQPEPVQAGLLKQGYWRLLGMFRKEKKEETGK